MLLEEYWLPNGKYHVTVESDKKDGRFLLKYPKCPVRVLRLYIVSETTIAALVSMLHKTCWHIEE